MAWQRYFLKYLYCRFFCNFATLTYFHRLKPLFVLNCRKCTKLVDRHLATMSLLLQTSLRPLRMSHLRHVNLSTLLPLSTTSVSGPRPPDPTSRLPDPPRIGEITKLRDISTLHDHFRTPLLTSRMPDFYDRFLPPKLDFSADKLVDPVTRAMSAVRQRLPGRHAPLLEAAPPSATTRPVAIDLDDFHRRALSRWPSTSRSLVFSYGSGVFKQEGQSLEGKVVDFVVVVEDAVKWHKENLQKNPSDYAG